MVKLMGSVCILTGGFLLWRQRMAERRRRRDTLSDLLTALRRMGEEVRMARPPLPWLLERLARDCGSDAAVFFRSGADTLRRGGNLAAAWQQAAGELPLSQREKNKLSELGCDLRGDEEKVCKAISLVIKELETEQEQMERTRQAEEKQLTAVCFSGAALLVILLI